MVDEFNLASKGLEDGPDVSGQVLIEPARKFIFQLSKQVLLDEGNLRIRPPVLAWAFLSGVSSAS